MGVLRLLDLWLLEISRELHLSGGRPVSLHVVLDVLDDMDYPDDRHDSSANGQADGGPLPSVVYHNPVHLRSGERERGKGRERENEREAERMRERKGERTI